MLEISSKTGLISIKVQMDQLSLIEFKGTVKMSREASFKSSEILILYQGKIALN